jgi:hypothetical protein
MIRFYIVLVLAVTVAFTVYPFGLVCALILAFVFFASNIPRHVYDAITDENTAEDGFAFDNWRKVVFGLIAFYGMLACFHNGLHSTPSWRFLDNGPREPSSYNSLFATVNSTLVWTPLEIASSMRNLPRDALRSASNDVRPAVLRQHANKARTSLNTMTFRVDNFVIGHTQLSNTAIFELELLASAQTTGFWSTYWSRSANSIVCKHISKTATSSVAIINSLTALHAHISHLRTSIDTALWDLRPKLDRTKTWSWTRLSYETVYGRASPRERELINIFVAALSTESLDTISSEVTTYEHAVFNAVVFAWALGEAQGCDLDAHKTRMPERFWEYTLETAEDRDYHRDLTTAVRILRDLVIGIRLRR